MSIPFLSNITIDDAGHIQFKTSAGANAGKIDQDGDNLVLSNAVGDIIIGNGSDDVYIGDGTNTVDIRFEQNMSIYADSSSTRTLTLGGANTNLILDNPTTVGDFTLASKLKFTGASGYILFDYEPSGDTGEYATEVPLLKVDQNGTESTILARVSEYRAVVLGIDDTVWLRAGDTGGVIKSNVNLANEVVLMSAEGGFHAYGFPGNDTAWSNRNEFKFYSQSTTAANNGLYIGDGGSTQFIDLSRNLKNIGTISSGDITSGAITSTGLTLTNQNPSLNFTDSSGSTYSAQWRFKDNDLQYLWGGGIKAYFTTNGIGIGDNGTTADARIERTGSSPYGLTFKTNNTSALSLDSSQNATFAGTISSGAITSTGTIKAATTFIADAVDGTNADPGTDNVRVSGYGMIGSRGNLYITNSSTSGSATVQIGVGGVHNASPKLSVGATVSSISTNLHPGADSTYNIGSSASRFTNGYFDALHTKGTIQNNTSNYINYISNQGHRFYIDGNNDDTSHKFQILANTNSYDANNVIFTMEQTGDATFAGTITANGTVLTGATDISGLVTKASAQTISGVKTFSSQVNITRAGNAQTSTLVLTDNARIMKLGRDAIDVYDVSDGSTARHLYLQGNGGTTQTGGNFVVGGGNITLNGTGRIQGIDTVSASTDAANRAYVDAAVADIVDSAPAALDTLNELAAALGDDASFSTTTATALGNRVRVDTASQGLTSTQKSNARTNIGAGTSSFDGAYSSLSSIPSSFTPSQHTQAISTVTGLQTALDAKLPLAGGTMTGDLIISHTDTSDPYILKLTQGNNGSGAGIQFNDNPSGSQKGYIIHNHSDSASYGGGASFHFLSSEDDLVLAVGNADSTHGRIAVWSGGNAAEADYCFAQDVNTGMRRTSADNVSLMAGGVAGVSVGATASSMKFSGNTKLLTATDGISVTGNIAVTGTVDGVDISALPTSFLALGTTSSTALAGNTTTISSGQAQKLGYITVTQAVNLDTIETNAANGNTAHGWGNHGTVGYLTLSSTQSKYLRSDTADTATGKITLEGNSAAWNTTTPGLTTGSLHFDPGVGTDHFGNAITFGASDSSNGTTAQAGIYLRTDGSYGSRMYFATTDSYASGSKVAMYINNNKDVYFLDNINVAGDIVVSGTVDGVDIATRDGVLTSTTTTANAALPKAGGTMTGDLVMQDEMVNFAAGNPELPNFKGKRSNTDLDDRQWDTEGGWSYTTFENNTTNKPSTGLHNGNGLLSFNTHSGDGSSNYMHQIAMTTNTNKLWHRRRNGSGGFGSWEEILKGSVAYSDLTGVPSTFAPAQHTQQFSTITSTPTTLSGYGITDAATSAQGTKADNALPKAGGTMTGDIYGTSLKIGGASGVNQIDFAAGKISFTSASTAVAAMASTYFRPNSDDVIELGNSTRRWKRVYGVTFLGGLDGSISSGTTAVTQSAGDNSTKVATTAFVAAAVEKTQTIMTSNFLDSGSTTSSLRIPFNNLVETTSNQYYNYFDVPADGTIKRVRMQNTSGTLSTGFTTTISIWKNSSGGSPSYTSSAQTASGGSIEVDPNLSISKGDKVQIGYTKSAGSKFWQGVSASIIIEFEQV